MFLRFNVNIPDPKETLKFLNKPDSSKNMINSDMFNGVNECVHFCIIILKGLSFCWKYDKCVMLQGRGTNIIDTYLLFLGIEKHVPPRF